MRPESLSSRTCVQAPHHGFSLPRGGARASWRAGHYCSPFRREFPMRRIFAALLAFRPAVPVAQDWHEPQRGSAGPGECDPSDGGATCRRAGRIRDRAASRLRQPGLCDLQDAAPRQHRNRHRSAPGWQTGCLLPDATLGRRRGAACPVRCRLDAVGSNGRATDVRWVEPTFCNAFRAVIADECP